MATHDEVETRVSPTRLDSATRLRRWAVRRARQALWACLALVCGTVAIIAAVLIWRGMCLIGLRDVGDPFDVAAVRSQALPDERNAFHYLREAMARLTHVPEVPRSVRNASPGAGWAKTDPRIRAWVNANRRALDLFRQGAEQEDALAHISGNESTFGNHTVVFAPLGRMSILEGSRLEHEGDMPDAWTWYRAVVRMRAHVMRRGTVSERLLAARSVEGLTEQVAVWAADPRTEVADLRRALDDAKSCAPRPEWESSSLKVDYLLALRELDRAHTPLRYGGDEDRAYQVFGEPLPPNQAQTLFAVRQFLIREPERSRRVLRMAFANWLAHVEIPEERHRKPAVRATYRHSGLSSGLVFFDAGSSAPSSARALPPRRLAEWLFSAPDVKMLLLQWPWPSVSIQERGDHRALVILLAEELYHREHGKPPASEAALVGSYLETLPDDGTEDLDDGTTPTVQEVQSSAAAAK